MLKREIAVAWILTIDNKTVIGEKNKTRGVWTDKIHQPGGGQDEGETLIEALVREVKEEAGLDIKDAEISLIDDSQTMITKKILPSGEKVDCEMKFYAYLVKLGKTADEYELIGGDDLINLKFVPIEELPVEKLTPPAVNIVRKLGWG